MAGRRQALVGRARRHARANFDKLVAQARSMYPAEVVDYLSFDPDEPQAFVGMARSRATA